MQQTAGAPIEKGKRVKHTELDTFDFFRFGVWSPPGRTCFIMVSRVDMHNPVIVTSHGNPPPNPPSSMVELQLIKEFGVVTPVCSALETLCGVIW